MPIQPACRSLAAAAVAASAALCAGGAFGATGLQRTFVASSGNDANGCTLTQPCRTFAAAMAAAAAGGEVVVLDTAGYGPIAIAKSIAIVAPAGIYAGITVTNGAGVVINTPGIAVTLRGLAINGQGGGNGIDFLQGAALHVEDCRITGAADNGINVRAPNSVVTIRDTLVRGSVNSGVYVDAFQTSITASIVRSHFERNQWGVYARQGAVVGVADSTFVANVFAGAYANTDNGNAQVTQTRLSVENSRFVGNLYGVGATAAPTYTTYAVVSRSAFTGDHTPVRAEGGASLYASANAISGRFPVEVDGASSSFTVSGNLVDGSATAPAASNGGQFRTFGNNSSPAFPGAANAVLH